MGQDLLLSLSDHESLSGEEFENIHTIERQDVLMMQRCTTWQFNLKPLIIMEGNVSRRCGDGPQGQTLRTAFDLLIVEGNMSKQRGDGPQGRTMRD